MSGGDKKRGSAPLDAFSGLWMMGSRCLMMPSQVYKWWNGWDVPVHHVNVLEMVPFRKLTKQEGNMLWNTSYTLIKISFSLSAEHTTACSLTGSQGRTWGGRRSFPRSTMHLSAPPRLLWLPQHFRAHIVVLRISWSRLDVIRSTYIQVCTREKYQE